VARKIQSRLKITGILVAQSPIHVGGINNNPQIDLALATNGQGQYYIPGTSLAGALRGWMENFINNMSQKNLEALWGFQEKNGQGGHASFVIVEDAPIIGAIAEIRDGVGINRMWGTAAEQVKYERAILPKGTKIPLDIALDIADINGQSEPETKNQKALLAQLLKALENSEIRLGAAKTRGLGKVKLQNLSIREHNFCNRSGILKMLQGKSNSLKLNDLLQDNSIFTPSSQINIEIHWEPQNSLMVKSEGDGIVVDILPLVSKVDNHLTFVLPGSSIKGALRTQAERIIRTVCPGKIQEKFPEPFMEQLELDLVEDLFGTRAKADNKNKKGIGSLLIDDCYAKVSINPSDWVNVQAAKENSDLRQALNNANLQTTQQAYHVAIDRWTGGAADGFLYSNLEPMGVTWEPISLKLDLHRYRKSQQAEKIALALIFFILRDLADNRIPLGYGTNRGMGSIKVTKVIINGQNLNESLKELEKKELPDGNITGLNEDLLNSLNEAWVQWINRPVEENKVC
jgi:CRISPR/Cas system CSM-associated protein Csm3 (group 7 of RAMP superfamily)